MTDLGDKDQNQNDGDWSRLFSYGSLGKSLDQSILEQEQLNLLASLDVGGDDNYEDGMLKHKRHYAYSIYSMCCCWMVATIFILISQGFSWHDFQLSDTVLVALLGTALATVMGLLFGVINNLFPKHTINETRGGPLVGGQNGEH